MSPQGLIRPGFDGPGSDREPFYLFCPKKSFYRALNAVFGRIGRIASEEVNLSLVKSKCLPCLLFGTEVCFLNKSALRSLNPNHVNGGVIYPPDRSFCCCSITTRIVPGCFCDFSC